MLFLAKAHKLTIRTRTVRVMRCYGNLCLKAQILTIIRQAVTRTSKMKKEEHAMEFTENSSADGIVDSVNKFLESGCKCSRGPKDGPCSSQFTEEEDMSNLNNCLKLSTKELDLVILANIQAVTRFENTGEKRSRSPRCNFVFQTAFLSRNVSYTLWFKLLPLSPAEGTLREQQPFI